MVSCQPIVKVVEKIYQQVFAFGILKTLPFCIGGYTLASSLLRDHLYLFPWLNAVVLGINLKFVPCSWFLALKQWVDSLVNSPNDAEAKTNIRIFAIPKLEGAFRT